MDLKPGEIIAIIFALAIPIAIFTVLLIPGAVSSMLAFALQPGVRELVFFGGAAAAFAALAWRIFRRIRPKPRDPKS